MEIIQIRIFEKYLKTQIVNKLINKEEFFNNHTLNFFK